MANFIGFAMHQNWGIKRVGPHNRDILEVIVGSLLEDGHLECRSNRSIRFTNTKSATGPNADYAYWLNSFFYKRGYTASLELNSYTHTSNDNREYFNVRIAQFTSLYWLYEAFYSTGVKVVPTIVKDYLTPLALAIWFMDDGSCQQRRIKFSTNCFTYNECVYLKDLLLELYDLRGSVCKSGYPNRYVIILSAHSFLAFKQ